MAPPVEWAGVPAGAAPRRAARAPLRRAGRCVPGLGRDLDARPAHGRDRRLELRRELPGGLDREARRARRGAAPLRAATRALRRPGRSSATSPRGRRTRRRTGCSSSSAAPRPAARPSSTRRCSGSARPRPGSPATTGSGRAQRARSATPRSRCRSSPSAAPRRTTSAASSRSSTAPRSATASPRGAPGSTATRPGSRSGSCSPRSRARTSACCARPTRVPLARKEGWTSKVRHTAAIAYTAAGPRIVVVLTFRPDEVSPAASRALGGDVNRSLGV